MNSSASSTSSSPVNNTSLNDLVTSQSGGTLATPTSTTSNDFNPVAAAVCHLANLANSYATSNAQISPISSTAQHSNFLGQNHHTTPQNNPSSFYNQSK